MASSKEYLEYVLDLLSGVEGVTTRKMMGEYLLYSNGTLFGGVYDDRFMLKPTATATARFAHQELPYEGAKPMCIVDVEDPEVIADVVARSCLELGK